jgi:hypothetical protein
MNFSARGYATLTARLKPDIAVLEGGYAVEKALPYVNLGIIMAMAGMDTSCVKEPNYDRDYKPQPPDIGAYIERLIGQLKSLFLGKQLPGIDREEGEILERDRNIFYDTDMIREKQHEKIRRCRSCAGALSIESSSSVGRRIAGIHIPRDACHPCQETALEWYEKARRGSFDYVYLQDRVQGIYERT